MQNSKIIGIKIVLCAIYGTDQKRNLYVYGKVTEFTIKSYYSSVEKSNSYFWNMLNETRTGPGKSWK